MKKILTLSVLTLAFLLSPKTYAGDCSTRTEVNWHATVSSVTHVRVNCDDHKGPVGDSIGVVSAGDVVRIVEVDQNREYFIIETENGRGFIYKSFLKDINEFPLPGANTQSEPEVQAQESSIFSDLRLDHQYYAEIADVKARGIISGNSEGKVNADAPINRAELAKILVEATIDSQTIATASLPAGIFSDVETGAWYLPYLQLAKEKGIMTGDKKDGFGPKTVRPGDFANGAEVAKMIAIAFNLEIRAAATGEAWFVPYLEVLDGMNAVPYSDAGHQVTRAEMMLMISRVLSQQEGS